MSRDGSRCLGGIETDTDQNEMRTARLQSQDLGRTGQFVHTLLSKEDVKDQDKPEAEQQKQQPNGAGLPFRTDPKTRFSDPPAPPPQQPLPEKPDIPSLKRGTTERPKSHPPNGSPTRDTVGQLLQLQEDLKNTRKELESRDAKVRELEEAILQERLARESAEDMARRLEESAVAAAAAATAAAAAVSKMNGSAVLPNGSDPLLNEAFDPPQEITSPTSPNDMDTPRSDVGKTLVDSVVENTEAAAAEYQSRIDAMAAEIQEMKHQLETWRQRSEKAEEERDAEKTKLADMVRQIRRDEEARKSAAAAQEKNRGRSKGRKDSPARNSKQVESTVPPTEADDGESSKQNESSSRDGLGDAPMLTRDSTITPQSLRSTMAPDPALSQSLPYASMLGVVLLGIGLMTYINGWQGPPKMDR